MRPTSGPITLRLLVALALCAAFWAVPSALWSQERLIDEEPHDLLTIPDGTDTKIIKVFPVRLPNRRIPKNPKPSDKIRVRLLEDDESRDFDVQWHDVKRLELFEDRILLEAETLSAAGKFDEAYANYAFLLKNYPNTLRLDESIQSYWYLSAGASYRAKRYDEALAVLEELLQKNPAYKHGEGSPSLMRVLGEIVDKLVQVHLDQGQYGPARQIVMRIARSYPDVKSEPFYSKYEERVRGAAEKKRDEARDHLAAKRFTEAYDATAGMMEVWPEVSGARELAQQMAEQYPLAVIAVDRFSTSPDAGRIDRWADLRAGRLTDRRLIEMRGIGPEGGEYVSPLGRCERSEDGRSLLLTLRPDAPLGAFDVLQLLLEGARSDSPFFSAGWAEVLGGARIVKAGQVESALRRTHLLPQALLAFPLSSEMPQGGGGYVLEPPEEIRSRFVWPAEAPSLPGKPREIQERLYSDPEAALLALARGEVDVMDRIQPADLAAVRALPGLTVGRYAVPTVHVLVPNFNRPWPAICTFRRAVMYGTNREAVLEQGVLRDAALPGAELVSGPFPAPLAQNDPLSYAYDDNVQPHAYEPLLAATLFNLAKRESEAAARTKNEEPPKFNGIVIGHLPLELHRIACTAMAKQLTALGIATTTLELGNEESAVQCDFVYTELLVTEPVIDVGRLFGPSGLYPAVNPHVRLGVRLVEQATTWNQAGLRLQSLHRTLHEDLTVLPLWQTPEHFAVRQNLKGVSASPISLYQDVDQWRVTPRLEQN